MTVYLFNYFGGLQRPSDTGEQRLLIMLWLRGGLGCWVEDIAVNTVGIGKGLMFGSLSKLEVLLEYIK